MLEALASVSDPEVSIPMPEKWQRAGEIVGDGWSIAWRTRRAILGSAPSVARESTLSQILQANAPEKYFLSQTACSGILRRAKARGKELPLMLKEALEEVVVLSARSNPG